MYSEYSDISDKYSHNLIFESDSRYQYFSYPIETFFESTSYLDVEIVSI